MSSLPSQIQTEINRAILEQSRFANEIVVRDVPSQPSIIWHYTTAEGLLGIVKNQELFMSHILCMNDTDEYRHGISHVIRACGIRDDSGISASAKKLHKALTAKLIGNINNTPDIFVSCFSGETDTHTHWLEYGRNGVGYAIGFDTARLLAVTDQYCAFHACIYKDERKQQIAVETLENADSALDAIIAAHQGIQEDVIIEEFAQRFSAKSRSLLKFAKPSLLSESYAASAI